jgi:signal peptidase I
VQTLAIPAGTIPARTERIRVRRKRRRLLTAIEIICAAALLGASAGLAFCVVSFHIGVRPVLTASMRPDYAPGAVLFTRRIPTSTIRPGMIVLFVPPGETSEFAHRVTSVSGPADAPILTTKGDANKVGDPWHARITAPYVSEVVGSLPGIGRLFIVVRGTGQIVLALVGSMLVIWGGTKWFSVVTNRSRSSRRRLNPGGA